MAKYDLDTIRHSTAHLMAQAVDRIYKSHNPQFGIGPVIENGFYYDIDLDVKIADEDLEKIEKVMQEIIDEKLAIKRMVFSRDEAVEFWKKKNQPLKVEVVSGIPADQEISLYEQGEFVDLCRGPHVENTGHLPKFFKLLHTAGAYWKGDSNNKMLQRIYAVSFNTKKQLEDHMIFLEEAKKRDHRKLGKEQELFHFESVAPASPFFMPKGTTVYNELVAFMRRIYVKYGYDEVITPMLLDSDLWHTSGHYAHYKENMYFSQVDKREFALKPMNCPCHMLMFKHYKYSYRDLPMRYADFGRLHRYESAGAVAGLTRVRSFCQDDAHIFISLEGIQEEIIKLMEMFFICYDHFGFKQIKIGLSTRPESKAGDDATWDVAEAALQGALDKTGHPYHINAGDGAFYGPKIDIQIADAIGRWHQLGTIQLDFQLPDRFDLKYTNEEGKDVRPVVIHRALLGSLERFIGVYLEHIAGIFPFWLSPEQATIVPVSNEKHTEYCRTLAKELRDMGFRVKVDERNETMGYKTRQIQQSKVPFMIVIGDREMENKAANIRAYGEQATKSLTIVELKEYFTKLNLERVPEKLR
ncbi:threonine--tRNA ligase [Bacteriovorax sp. PP10]|uniref:Threonine--tRNA ligase n=1 Tax=Bacteriovorax antarcticus TaxID=3088717 RepID=A0ABU5W178_9BACT|nr:threonine--tRNA ligase [Bacteriovorax sp. PP10]MEA9358577.1 threonine--tRNA ligase [Bacteriovorax sp. PP10]